ncbi:hypothetical protein PIB30_050485 [Stylosanthes scabra]|uniref:Uncharacterized protein n=1 Tax=Stylosanthes scabra TaxID=79078 RepID=A0ABU6YGF8_9FABA|nr:hypothetical protein [Stylosanthes scabra]
MPRKGADSGRQKARRRGRTRAKDTASNSAWRSAPTPRYASFHGFNAFVDVVLSTWRARNVRCVPRICRELPTTVEEDTRAGVEGKLEAVEDLKQNLLSESFEYLVFVIVSVTKFPHVVFGYFWWALNFVGLNHTLLHRKSVVVSRHSCPWSKLRRPRTTPSRPCYPSIPKPWKPSWLGLMNCLQLLPAWGKNGGRPDMSGLVCDEVSGVSDGAASGSGSKACKAEDLNILYSLKQRYVRSPFAFCSHNQTEMIAEELPQFMRMSFRPPPGMKFIGTELAIAAYIFASKGKDNEVLYQDNHCDGSRRRFLSLVPGRELYDDVLNMVVGMCSGTGSDKTKWWLPTTFSASTCSPSATRR